MVVCEVPSQSPRRKIWETHAMHWNARVRRSKTVMILFSWLRQICEVSSHSSLQWRHNEPNGTSNHHPHNCLHNRLFRRRSKKTSKPCVTGLCEGNSPVTGEFPAQMASNAENVSIWWRHHDEGEKYEKHSIVSKAPRCVSESNSRGEEGIKTILNPLRPHDAMRRHKSRPALAQEMACCLTEPNHYLNQCYLIIRGYCRKKIWGYQTVK